MVALAIGDVSYLTPLNVVALAIGDVSYLTPLNVLLDFL